LEEKKMFGGVGFLVNGNMACGVHKKDMIVRVGPENHKDALARPHTHIFDMTGRPMAGWVMVEPEGCATENDLKGWIQQGLAFAHTLPAKEK
jgi:TfoX/Sxy family transcriptional regulator of competence genes